MKKRYIKKILAVTLILLCVIFAFIPNIHAGISKKSDLVVKTEICGLPNMNPQTVRLTEGDAFEVEKLFEEINLKFVKIASIEDAVEIFNEAIVGLNKYNLLGGLNIEQAKNLVTRRLQNSGNELCLVVGRTSETVTYGPGITVLTQIIQKLPLTLVRELFMRFLFFYYALNVYRPFNFFGLGHTICIGRYVVDEVSGNRHQPGYGWLITFGLNGKQNWSDSMYGNLSMSRFERSFFGLGRDIDYPGIAGFLGLKINLEWLETNWFYFGSALQVEIREV